MTITLFRIGPMRIRFVMLALLALIVGATGCKKGKKGPYFSPQPAQTP
jgi:predicted small lipoprotein YifL